MRETGTTTGARDECFKSLSAVLAATVFAIFPGMPAMAQTGAVGGLAGEAGVRIPGDRREPG